ncbi:hypothetical protein EYF80_032132 [Liparis tanakae]|uniref:Uncharacterized protein n=1 Tax=Liparis tanakae TaxID=230148 RepID=A0A4Z2GWN6_9TELE|nr:hypothetical protein EYF80_032132 [Liparis tanakae]
MQPARFPCNPTLASSVGSLSGSAASERGMNPSEELRVSQRAKRASEGHSNNLRSVSRIPPVTISNQQNRTPQTTSGDNKGNDNNVLQRQGAMNKSRTQAVTSTVTGSLEPRRGIEPQIVGFMQIIFRRSAGNTLRNLGNNHIETNLMGLGAAVGTTTWGREKGVNHGLQQQQQPESETLAPVAFVALSTATISTVGARLHPGGFITK